MNKLKKSVKIILISAIAVVCALAVVLGCVLGIKKPDSSSANPDEIEFVNSRNNLFSLINSQKPNKVTLEDNDIEKIVQNCGFDFKNIQDIGDDFIFVGNSNNNNLNLIYYKLKNSNAAFEQKYTYFALNEKVPVDEGFSNLNFSLLHKNICVYDYEIVNGSGELEQADRQKNFVVANFARAESQQATLVFSVTAEISQENKLSVVRDSEPKYFDDIKIEVNDNFIFVYYLNYRNGKVESFDVDIIEYNAQLVPPVYVEGGDEEPVLPKEPEQAEEDGYVNWEIGTFSLETERTLPDNISKGTTEQGDLIYRFKNLTEIDSVLKISDKAFAISNNLSTIVVYKNGNAYAETILDEVQENSYEYFVTNYGVVIETKTPVSETNISSLSVKTSIASSDYVNYTYTYFNFATGKTNNFLIDAGYAKVSFVSVDCDNFYIYEQKVDSKNCLESDGKIAYYSAKNLRRVVSYDSISQDNSILSVNGDFVVAKLGTFKINGTKTELLKTLEFSTLNNSGFEIVTELFDTSRLVIKFYTPDDLGNNVYIVDVNGNIVAKYEFSQIQEYGNGYYFVKKAENDYLFDVKGNGLVSEINSNYFVAGNFFTFNSVENKTWTMSSIDGTSLHDDLREIYLSENKNGIIFKVYFADNSIKSYFITDKSAVKAFAETTFSDIYNLKEGVVSDALAKFSKDDNVISNYSTYEYRIYLGTTNNSTLADLGNSYYFSSTSSGYEIFSYLSGGYNSTAGGTLKVAFTSQTTTISSTQSFTFSSYQTSMTLTVASSKAGYSFVGFYDYGWNDDGADGGESWGSVLTLSTSYTSSSSPSGSYGRSGTYYVAVWQISEYNITYVVNVGGGTLNTNYLSSIANAAEDGGYNFTLNPMGYYESSNAGVASSYSLAKVTFYAVAGSTIYFDCVSYGESSYDYGLLSNLDSTLSADNSVDSSYYYSFNGKSSSSEVTVSYSIETTGTHFVYVKYRKDGSVDSYDDSFKFKVRPGSTTTNSWVYLPTNPTRTGYTFNGWSVSGLSGTTYYGTSTSSYSSTTSSTISATKSNYFKGLSESASLVTFTASWTAITYNISVLSNNGSVGSSIINPCPQTTGQSSTAPSPTTVTSCAYDTVYGLSLTSVSRTGYTFTGWRFANMDSVLHYIGGSATVSVSGFLFYIYNINYTGYTSTSSQTYVYTSTASSPTDIVYFRNLRSTSGTVQISAMWKPNTYSISYELNGGTSGGTQPTSVQYNTGNYGFTRNIYGYFESQNFGVDNSYSMIRLSLTTTSANQVLTFNVINYAESNYDYGIFSNLDSPLLNSYTADTSNVYKSFKGSSSSSVQTFTYTVPTAGSHYIYVKYRKDGSQSTGHDSLQFTVSGYNTLSYSTSYNAGFNVSYPTKANYTFNGWNVSGGTTSYSNTKITTFSNLRSTSGTVTFSAQWTPKTYSITMNNLGSTFGTLAVTYNTSWSPTSITIPTRTGYRFLGFYTGQNGTGTQIVDSAGNIVASTTYFTSNQTIYAHWIDSQPPTIEAYTVVQDGNRGFYIYAYVTDNIDVDKVYFLSWGFNSEIDDIFDLDDESILGNIGEWTIDGQYYNYSYYAPLNENGTGKFDYGYDGAFFDVYAYDSVGNEGIYLDYDGHFFTFNVSIDRQGGSGGTSSFSVTYGQSYSISQIPSLPTKFGYNFAGLYTQTFGRGEKIADETGKIVGRNTFTTDDATVYVRWVAQEYSINYVLQADGGSTNGKFDSGSIAPNKASFDSEFFVSNPVRAGYTFVGWNLSGLLDSIAHYYTDSAEHSFTSIGGRYVQESNLNESIIVNAQIFKNLHALDGNIVTLTAIWSRNNYDVNYYYLPSDFNAATDISSIGVVGKRTEHLSSSAEYDRRFIAPIGAYKEGETGIYVPQELVFVGWVFLDYIPELNVDLASLTSGLTFNEGEEILFDFFKDETGFREGEIYAFALYRPVEITIIYKVADSDLNKNDLSHYVEYKRVVTSLGEELTFVQDIADVYGFMISENNYTSGQLTGGIGNNTSVTTFKYNDTTYTALAGETVPWGYPGSNAFNPRNPVYYVYAVYSSTN